jgi:nicotinamide-nucleotide amidase
MYDLKRIGAIKDYMLKNKQTLSAAESVTSGHLQAALSLADGASDFFQGGITVYNLGQKTRHLDVDPIMALSCNCVSPETARQMTCHVTALFISNWGISITGYAAPVPELEIKDLFAFYAISFEGKIKAEGKLTSAKTNILDVQVGYTNAMLEAFANVLNKA